MVNLDEVLTFSEAAEKWGLADGKTIRKAVERHRFESHEIKRSGNVWLTTYDAMVRVFGEPRHQPVAISFFEIMGVEDMQIQLELFFQQAEEAIQRGEMVSIIERKDQPDRIVCILKSMEELAGWKRRLQYYLHTPDK